MCVVLGWAGLCGTLAVKLSCLGKALCKGCVELGSVLSCVGSGRRGGGLWGVAGLWSVWVCVVVCLWLCVVWWCVCVCVCVGVCVCVCVCVCVYLFTLVLVLCTK